MRGGKGFFRCACVIYSFSPRTLAFGKFLASVRKRELSVGSLMPPALTGCLALQGARKWTDLIRPSYQGGGGYHEQEHEHGHELIQRHTQANMLSYIQAHCTYMHTSTHTNKHKPLLTHHGAVHVKANRGHFRHPLVPQLTLPYTLISLHSCLFAARNASAVAATDQIKPCNM